MSQLGSVEVAEMERLEAKKIFMKYSKLKTVSQETEEEIDAIIGELGYLALAITLAGSCVSTTSRLSSDLRQDLLEYRQRCKTRREMRELEDHAMKLEKAEDRILPKSKKTYQADILLTIAIAELFQHTFSNPSAQKAERHRARNPHFLAKVLCKVCSFMNRLATLPNATVAKAVKNAALKAPS
jgi:hypothetical protein